jgi:hypothetical protein
MTVLKYYVPVIRSWSFCLLLFALSVLVWTERCYAILSESQGSYGTNSISAYNPLAGPPYPLLQDSYFTDDYGNILMIVNVLGEVNRPGQYVVRENADISTVLTLAGGLGQEANLKKVLVARREPDDDGRQAYIINLKSYFTEGDRSFFIALKPNDTIIIPEKGMSLTKAARLISIAYPFINFYDIIKSR